MEKLLHRYRDLFTNARTKQAYDSIYVFCNDIARAAQWAISYCEYVKIFDFEADLLARITRDLAEEFLENGKLLIADNQLEDAKTRLGWAKSLFIRHEQFSCLASQPEKSPQPGILKDSEKNTGNHTHSQALRAPQSSKELIAVDRLLTEIDDGLQQEQKKDFDDVSMGLREEIAQQYYRLSFHTWMLVVFFVTRRGSTGTIHLKASHFVLPLTIR